MENLRPSQFRINKNVVSGAKKRSAEIIGKEIRPKAFRQKCPSNFEKAQFLLE